MGTIPDHWNLTVQGVNPAVPAQIVIDPADALICHRALAVTFKLLVAAGAVANNALCEILDGGVLLFSQYFIWPAVAAGQVFTDSIDYPGIASGSPGTNMTFRINGGAPPPVNVIFQIIASGDDA